MDITSIFVTAIIFVTLYKIIYLLAHRKERLRLIDKLDSACMAPPEFQSNVNALMRSAGAEEILSSFRRYTALRWGAACSGAGFGLMVGFMISQWFGSNLENWGYYQEGVVYGSCLLLFIGIAMIIAFIIELNMRRKQV